MKYPNSLFSQVLALVPRHLFARLAREMKVEAYSKGFSSWEQFVSLLFCQMAQAKSLREIAYGLGSCLGKLNHLGMRKLPARSTLSYANEHRDWRFYQALFEALYAQCRQWRPGLKRKFRFKNPLLSLDATVIELALSLFPWADFRTRKGAVKLHLLLDHNGYLPCFAVISDGNTHELEVIDQFHIAPQSIVVMDRAYIDYGLFGRWSRQGVYFVTRCKRNTYYELIQELPLSDRARAQGVLADQLVQLQKEGARAACPHHLRVVTMHDPEHPERPLVFLTNHLKLAPQTIAEIYRDRWEIELFFKTLKQHLKIKSFIGTSPNALHSQIWTALIALLLLKVLHWQSSWGGAFSTFIALLHWHLFSHRNLAQWLRDPCQLPPARAPALHQPTLPFLDSTGPPPSPTRG